jgi:hypothetical protein
MGFRDNLVTIMRKAFPKSVSAEEVNPPGGIVDFFPARVGEVFKEMSSYNPKFPKVIYILAAVAALIVIVELYVTIMEYAHGNTKEYQDAQDAKRRLMEKNKKKKRRISIADQAKDAFQSTVEALTDAAAGTRGKKKKVPKVDLEQFLYDLNSHGITVKRIKNADGQSPTPSKIKNLRIRPDGDLYFYTETFKVRSLVVSPETWSVKELVSCLEGDATLGEIYLEFHAPKNAVRIMRIMVPDDVERVYIIKAFSDIVEAMVTHPEWVMDTLKKAEEHESEMRNGIESGPSSAASSPRAAAAPVTATPAKMSPTRKQEAAAAAVAPPAHQQAHTSQLLRSPIKTPARSPDRRDKSSASSSASALRGGAKIPNSPELFSSPGVVKTPVYDLNVDFHTFTNKELKSAILYEGLENHAKAHRERQDLIKILEGHYYQISRAMNREPIVTVKTDFEAQLRDIYEHYNPQKLPEVPRILEHFKGKEEHLLEQLYLKYDIKEHHHHLLGATEGH